MYSYMACQKATISMCRYECLNEFLGLGKKNEFMIQKKMGQAEDNKCQENGNLILNA